MHYRLIPRRAPLPRREQGTVAFGGHCQLHQFPRRSMAEIARAAMPDRRHQTAVWRPTTTATITIRTGTRSLPLTPRFRLRDAYSTGCTCESRTPWNLRLGRPPLRRLLTRFCRSMFRSSTTGGRSGRRGPSEPWRHGAERHQPSLPAWRRLDYGAARSPPAPDDGATASSRDPCGTRGRDWGLGSAITGGGRNLQLTNTFTSDHPPASTPGAASFSSSAGKSSDRSRMRPCEVEMLCLRCHHRRMTGSPQSTSAGQSPLPLADGQPADRLRRYGHVHPPGDARELHPEEPLQTR